MLGLRFKADGLPCMVMEEEAWEEIGQRLRAAVAEHRVNDRPGRCEPRAQKRRPPRPTRSSTSRDRARERLTAKCCG
jgi:hypothetical protein